MKILHITATHLNQTGGVPVVLRNLIEEQNKLPNITSALLSLRANTDMIDNQKFFFREKQEWSVFIEGFAPDVVIIHSFFYFEYIIIAAILSTKKIPYYIEPHGSFGKAAMQKSKVKKAIANNTVFRKLIKNAHGYVFLSNEEMEDSIYRKKHDIVIPNGIISADLHNSSHDNSLYFIGRYDINHKGLDALFEALKILDEKNISLKIDLYGTGSEEEIQYINDRIKQLKTVKCINHGPLYGDIKTQELEKHGIMILTSRYEGFPMTVLEAWQMGIPCIVTPGTNVSIITKKENIGWVADFDPPSIADTIIKALEMYKVDMNGYINRTIECVNKYFLWSRIAEQSILALKNERQ